MLPLTTNDAILGYISYFSGRGRRTIENGLMHAGKYDAMITKIFAEEGDPAGADPARPGGVRFYAARRVGGGSQRDVAVREIPG